MEDEQPVPPHGLAHSLPHLAPGWLGPIGGQPQVQQHADESQVGDAPMSNVKDPMDDDLEAGGNMSSTTKTDTFSGAAADFAASGGV